MEDIIIRKNGKGANTWYVEQGNKKSVECGWDEMIGLISSITMPTERPCLQWMKEKEYEPKDGDFVTFGPKSDAIGIFRKGEGITHTDYVVLDEGRLVYDSCWWTKENLRPATESEKQQLLDALHEEGKDLDAEKKKIVDWKWRPVDGEDFYYPRFNYQLCMFESYSDVFKKEEYLHTWVLEKLCKTHKECQASCDKLNEAIKNVK